MRRRDILRLGVAGAVVVPGVAPGEAIGQPVGQRRPAAAPPLAPQVGPLPPLPVAVPESIGLSAPRLVQVTEVLEAAVGAGRINGAVLGLARQGKLGWLRAVGFRDTAQAERLLPDAIFPLGALTRPIAVVAAMVLVERGRLKLTDPVAAHLPVFRELRVAIVKSAGEKSAGEKRDGDTVELGFELARRPVTIQDLMRHTAGFTSGVLTPETPVGRMYVEAGVHAPGKTLAEAMEALAKLPLVRQPGVLWEDSVATDVLARVVEVVSGQPFDRFVAREVTAPWRMVDTGYGVAASALGRLAEPRVDPMTGAVPGQADMRAAAVRIGGDGGMVGTAGDYLRFGQAMLAGGVLDGARVLGAGTVAHMTSDHLGQIAHDSPSGNYLLGEGRGFGLGVSVRLGNGVNAMPGSAGDFDWSGTDGCQFLVDPARELVAVLMLNQRNQFDHFFRLFRTLVYQTVAR